MPHSPKPFFFSVLFLLSATAYAQQTGYLKTPELLYYGTLHGLNAPNAKGVVFEFNNGNKRTFSPSDAIEFGTEDKRKWVSRDFGGEKLFFEELEKGKVNLLMLQEKGRKSYFIEKAGQVMAMSAQKSDTAFYKDILLSELSDCYLTEKSIELARYKTANLKYFLSQYNDCLHKPFPKFRVGPLVGLRFYTNEITSKFFPKGVPEEHLAPSLGAIIELPVSIKPQILLVTQPVIATYSFATFSTFYNVQTAVTSNTTHYLEHVDLDLPVMLKYRTSYYRASPFIQLGLAYQLSFAVRSYAVTDQYQLRNNRFELVAEDIRTDSDALAKGYMGAVGGVGIEVPINPYITTVIGSNFSVFNAKVETGKNRKTYPELYLAVIF